jgi:hypothetical protein
MKTLRTASEVIQRLGGLKAVADLTGRGYTAAHNWKQAGFFPSSTYLLMSKALERAGYGADAVLWRMEGAPRRGSISVENAK